MNANEIIEVAVERIVEDASQPRGDSATEGLLALGRTMLESGQVEPLLAYLEGDEYRLLSGGRRLRAARLVGIKTLKLRVVEKPSTPATAVEVQLLANLHEPLAPMDYAKAVVAYRTATGLPAARVAERLGTSPASISRAERLANMPARVQALVSTGALAPDVAYQISLADPKEQEALAERAACQRMSRDGVAAVVRGKRSGSVGEPRAAKRTTAVLGGGRQVTFSAPEGLTMAAVIETLEDLLGKARKYRNRGVDLPTWIEQLRVEAKMRAGQADSAEASP